MLKIENLKCELEDGTEILKGINLEFEAGKVHAIMGPNGSGKSTLSKVLAGHPNYNVTEGTIVLDGKDLDELEASERSNEGIFIGYQYPVEIPGVNNLEFLKLALNAKRSYLKEDEVDEEDFNKIIDQHTKALKMDEKYRTRAVNSGFSGGEKKRNEILQLSVLNPKVAFLDETDSGLDIDALRVVGQGINAIRHPERTIVLVTHYQRLLDLVKPDFVHVLSDGQIVKSGGPELALELEEKGYDWITADTVER